MAKRLPAHGRVTVILPTRDEVHNIDEVVARVLEEGDRASLDVEVLVVDDTSTDGTRERVRGWESRDARVRLLARDAERGLAGAVLAGARFASGEVIVVMDADLSHPASAVAALARPVLDGACDMAIGSRYIPGGATPGWPFSRRLISRTAATLARLLVDVRDPCSGFFAVRKQTLLEARKAPGGFKIGLEILARSQPGQRVEDIPITFRTRAHGASKLDARVVLSYLAQLVDLVGAGPSGREASGFALAAGLGFLLDIAIFHALLAEGAPLALAHLTSFAAAISATCLLGAWAGFPGRHCARGSVALTRYGAFIAVALLAVLLRGGVLALAHRSLGLPAPAAIVPAALVAAMTSYIGGCSSRSGPPIVPKN